MDLYNAQRTNFQTAMPRLATKPGQQRQTTQRSTNRGKAEMPMPKGPMPMPPGNAGGSPMLMPKRPMPAGVDKGQRPAPVAMMPGNADRPPMLAKKPMSADMIKKMAAFKPTGV